MKTYLEIQTTERWSPKARRGREDWAQGTKHAVMEGNYTPGGEHPRASADVES